MKSFFRKKNLSLLKEKETQFLEFTEFKKLIK